MGAKVAEQIMATLRRHPRIAYQQLLNSAAELKRLRECLPELVPFNTGSYAGFVSVIDWDHRMPSTAPVLRVYAYYSDRSLARGRADFDRRTTEIRQADAFPEFDVRDYADLAADEAYEGILDRAGELSQLRLSSEWRREITAADAYAAIEVVRQSKEFRSVMALREGEREQYLGDLEAVSWTPPCESGYHRWTIDVWYVVELDVSFGRGRSFLIDLQDLAAVKSREFVVRPG